MFRDTKHGRGNPELVELLGSKCVGIDVNSMKPLLTISATRFLSSRRRKSWQPDAFGAAHAFLMVGGTTSAVPEHGAVLL